MQLWLMLPINGQAASRVGHGVDQQERSDARQGSENQQYGQAAFFPAIPRVKQFFRAGSK
jgi:hypothetical protein